MERPDPSQMSDREILEELLQDKRRRDRLRLIRYIILGILLIALLVLAAVYVPKITALYRELNGTMQQVDQTMGDVSQTMEKINEALQQLQSDYAAAKSAGQEALENAADTLNGLLEKLQILNIFR